MLQGSNYKRLVQEAPEAVMVRMVLEHSLESDAVDEVFENSRDDQYTRTLLFSSIVDLMTLVVCRARRSVSAAFQFCRDKFDVSLKSVYNKLNATDPTVCRALLRHSAERMTQVIVELGVSERPLIPGYNIRILDGNQLAATEHRIKELRTIASGPLPGKSLVVWNADLGMISDVYCCEDSYTQERHIMREVFANIQAGELWIADRNFCTSAILRQIGQRGALFVIRQHARNAPFRATGPERQVAVSETGVVHETPVVIEDALGGSIEARLVRVKLKSATRDGDLSIQVFTNLPPSVTALQVAEAYRRRWRIETAFFELDRVFEGEIKTLGHPGAALLAFTMSLIAYNALRVVRTALAAVHGQPAADRTSDYYLTENVIADWRALDIVSSPENWTAKYGNATPRTLALALKQAAKYVKMERLRKSTRGPKKPRPKRIRHKRKPHVSTYRVIKARSRVTWT